jgi:hypothetical protein
MKYIKSYLVLLFLYGSAYDGVAAEKRSCLLIGIRLQNNNKKLKIEPICLKKKRTGFFYKRHEDLSNIGCDFEGEVGESLLPEKCLTFNKN